jgi:DNA-binding GntR family transcriptional regulator
MDLEPIEAGSVAEIAYAEIRRMIVQGTLPHDERLNQRDLAVKFGISTTSVREALHRLVGDTLVDFRRNRGFFVAAPFDLNAVVDRLEVRLALEPFGARLAAKRRSEADVRELKRVISGEARADSPGAAHDLSRDFHVAVSRASGNGEFTRTLEALWLVDIGRQLLARRLLEDSQWQGEDVAEHAVIAAAIEGGDGELAENLMLEHLSAVHSHWNATLREPLSTEPSASAL